MATLLDPKLFTAWTERVKFLPIIAISSKGMLRTTEHTENGGVTQTLLFTVVVELMSSKMNVSS